MTYRAPLDDILLALNQGAGLQRAIEQGHCGSYDADTTAAVLEEAGRFAEDVLDFEEISAMPFELEIVKLHTPTT